MREPHADTDRGRDADGNADPRGGGESTGNSDADPNELGDPADDTDPNAGTFTRFRCNACAFIDFLTTTMKRSRLIRTWRIWSWAVGIAILSPLSGRAASDEALRARYAPAVVRIETVNPECASSGTGFFVSPDGLVMTNLHVMACALAHGGAGIKITHDGKSTRAYRIASCGRNFQQDLCVLKIDAYPRVHFTARSALPPEGEPVFTLGHPRGQWYVLSSGALLGRANLTGWSEVAISVPIQPGNSGGPIFTADGTLVGVVAHTMTRVLSGLRPELQPNRAQAYGISTLEVDRFLSRMYSGGNFRYWEPATYLGAHPETQEAVEAYIGDRR